MTTLCMLIFLSCTLYIHGGSRESDPFDITEDADLLAQIAQSRHVQDNLITEDNDNDDTDALLLFVCCIGILNGFFDD